MDQLSPPQSKVFRALSNFINEKGYSPSLRQLAHLLGLGNSTVVFHLSRLQDKGYIRWPKNSRRAIQLVKRLMPNRIPLLGAVPAGNLKQAVEVQGESVEVDPKMIKGKSFAVKVTGDSMEGAHIVEGDIVVVGIDLDVKPGDIIVARIEDETTIKYLRYIKGEPYLVPANEKYKPIPAGRAAVVGKVTGILRRY